MEIDKNNNEKGGPSVTTKRLTDLSRFSKGEHNGLRQPRLLRWEAQAFDLWLTPATMRASPQPRSKVLVVKSEYTYLINA